MKACGLWALALLALGYPVAAQPLVGGAPPAPGQYAFAGYRISSVENYRIPITSTAIRGAFTLDTVPGAAYLIIEVDDQFNAYINGTLAGSIQTFTKGNARAYPIADLLKTGKNVVAVEAYSALDKMSVGLDIRANAHDGPVLLTSGPDFKARLCPTPPDLEWTKVDFDDTEWDAAAVLEKAGALALIECERSRKPFAFPPEAYLPSLIPAEYAFQGQWIQPSPVPGQGQEGAVFASFTVAKDQYEHVVLYVTGDDRYMLYVNGTQLGWDWSPVSWNCGEVFDISDVLIDGPNFVTIRLRNDLPPYCAALCEVWGLNGGDSFTHALQRDLLLATSAEWDSMLGNLYEDRGKIQKALPLGKPPREPWFTLKAIPCRLMPTNE